MDETKDKYEDLTNQDQFRYATPTFASSLPRYQRGELERIRNSFHKGSHFTVRSLPSNLAPGEVHSQRIRRIGENLSSKPENTYKASVTPHYFGKLHYQYNDFLKETDLHKDHVEEERVKVDTWSRKPFSTTNRVKLKHEESFSDSNYKFSNHGPGTGVPKLETMIRTDLNDSSKFLNGKFHSYVKKERQVSRSESRIWAKQIYEKLSTDWPHLKFKVKFTENDEFLICFPVDESNIIVEEKPLLLQNTEHGEPDMELQETNDSVDIINNKTSIVRYEASPSEKVQWNSVCKYMKNMATHGVAFQCGLQKRGDRWRRLELEQQPVPPVSPTRKLSHASTRSCSSDESLTTPPDNPVLPGVYVIVFSFYAPWVKVLKNKKYDT